MDSSEVTEALDEILTMWRHQPMSANERDLWKRNLRPVSRSEFAEAVERLAKRAIPERPSIAEFNAVVRGVRVDMTRKAEPVPVDADKLSELYGKPREPWPPPGTTPAYASEHFKAARALVP